MFLTQAQYICHISRHSHAELRALNRARCRRCGRYRSFLVSHWIISICRQIGGHITLSAYTYHTSPLFETLGTEPTLRWKLFYWPAYQDSDQW